MYVYFIIAVMLFLSIYEIVRTKFFFNPLSVFLFLWSAILFFSKLALFDLYVVSNNTYNMIITGVISFVFGYYICNAIFKRKKNKKMAKNLKKFNLRYNLLIVLSLLCIVFYSIMLIRIIYNLDDFNMFNIQHLLRKSNELLITSSSMRFISSFIVGPVSFALPFIVVTDFMFGKRNKPLLFFATIVILLKTITMANRATLMIYVLLFIVFGIIKINISDMDAESKKKIRRTISRFALIGAVAFVILSISRNLVIFKSLYLDFAIPPIMFEKWGAVVTSQNLYGYGTASFAGVIYPVLYPIYKVFNLGFLPSHFESVYNLIALTDDKWILAGQGISANAYVSMFWFFFTDFRIWGIIFGSALLGVYSNSKLHKISNSIKDIALYGVCIIVVIYSICRIEFTLTNFVLAILFLKLFAFKRDEIDE